LGANEPLISFEAWELGALLSGLAAFLEEQRDEKNFHNNLIHEHVHCENLYPFERQSSVIKQSSAIGRRP
jgi:ferritin